eukprot:gb/GEZJ01002044.1/.p1 GENE.gb/GEZJ01002044.1/~~gb/GEZJ01002044.1/.p1  ORF type:complete len:412 (+),score=52.62 gb/GEZJ01002044.1/:1017-2252(+)
MAFVCVFTKLPSYRISHQRCKRLDRENRLRRQPSLSTPVVASLDIAVIGAGTAGLTSALLLQRQGHNVTLFERAPMPRTEGCGVFIRGSAIDALENAGATDVAESLSQSGVPLSLFSYRDYNNNELSRQESDKQHKYISRTLRRSDVVDALWQPFKRAVHMSAAEFKGGKKLTNVVDVGDKVVAQFADGTTWSGDVLLGADGIRSQAAMFVAPQRKLGYLGDLVWRGISEDDALCVDGVSVVYPRKNGFYANCFDLGTDSDGRSFTHWGVFVESPYPENASERKAVKERGIPEEVLNTLPTAYVNVVTQATNSNSANKTLVVGYYFDFDPLSTYVRGRVALLGDAAHSMASTLSWGMASGIEDAVCLASKLEMESEVSSALRSYEEERLPVTHGYQNDSRTLSRRLKKKPE